MEVNDKKLYQIEYILDILFYIINYIDIDEFGVYESIPGCAEYNSPRPSMIGSLIDNIPNKDTENKTL